MPTNNAYSERTAEGAPPPPNAGLQDPWCPDCRTADHLVFEAAVPRIDAAGARSATWDVEYWCTRCDGYFGHETGRLPEAAVCLASDAVYVHCGQVMSPGAIEPRTIGAAGETAKTPSTAVVLDAQLWRCRCGFELAVPDRDDS